MDDEKLYEDGDEADDEEEAEDDDNEDFGGMNQFLSDGRINLMTGRINIINYTLAQRN